MFPILSIIIVVFLHPASARNDSLSKHYQFPNQNLVLADPSFNNKSLFYALHTPSSKQCTIVQEINPFTNNSMTKQCKFVTKVDAVQLTVGFGTEKAVLITQEATSESLKLKAVTVHMDGCKIVNAELAEVPLNWASRKMYRDHIDVVVSEKGFEVIIKGLSHLCTKSDAKIYCGVSFDGDGNKIEGPLIWPKMAYDKIDVISPVMADSTGQGYFFVNRDESSLLAFQFNRKGGPKFVKLWYTAMQHTNLWREGYSAANEVDGMCFNVESKIGCWQTDREGELKINMEFEFDPAFKAIIKQCNTTQPPGKIQSSTTQQTTAEDTTIQGTTTESTTIEVTTEQETTITDTTSQETLPSETAATQDTVASEANVTEAITEETLGTDLEGTTVNETAIQENTEDDTMLPITVKGLTVGEVATQEVATQNMTLLDETTQDSAVTENIIESTETQESITEDATVRNDTTQESDAVQNSTSENTVIQESATQEPVTIDNITLDNTIEDNMVLENTTEYNTVQAITVQGLTTEASTTQESVPQENATESAISQTTLQGISFHAFTVQGITDNKTTRKILIRRSLAEGGSGKHQVWNMFIHNLRNGGFIMYIITCPNRVCSGIDDHYYLVKINALGKRVGQLEINVNSKCNPENGEVVAKVFENDQGQYCAVRLCKSKLQKEAQLETLVNCYCNSDFK